MSTSRKIQSIKIYALMHEHNVFIGKTQGDIDPVYYRHRRAENPFTEKYFYPKNSNNPSIHILECISCNFHEGYRHIVAWVRIFQDAGYKIINPWGTVEDANDLHPQTTELVHRLQPISLETFMNETQHKKQNKSTPPSTLELPERTNNRIPMPSKNNALGNTGREGVFYFLCKIIEFDANANTLVFDEQSPFSGGQPTVSGLG